MSCCGSSNGSGYEPVKKSWTKQGDIRPGNWDPYPELRYIPNCRREDYNYDGTYIPLKEYGGCDGIPFQEDNTRPNTRLSTALIGSYSPQPNYGAQENYGPRYLYRPEKWVGKRVLQTDPVDDPDVETYKPCCQPTPFNLLSTTWNKQSPYRT